MKTYSQLINLGLKKNKNLDKYLNSLVNLLNNSTLSHLMRNCAADAIIIITNGFTLPNASMKFEKIIKDTIHAGQIIFLNKTDNTDEWSKILEKQYKNDILSLFYLLQNFSKHSSYFIEIYSLFITALINKSLFHF